MDCMKCGHKTKVVDSRNRDSKSSFGGKSRIEANVSWYTQDWVYRRRRCLSCSSSVITIEIPMDDLERGWSPTDQSS